MARDNRNIGAVRSDSPIRSKGMGASLRRAPWLPLLVVASFPARADLPLTVEELLTAENRWRAEFAAVYANTERQGVSTGEPILVQTGDTQYVSIPTRIGASRINTDTWVLTPGLRYGLSADTEIYGHASWLAQRTRSEDPAGAAGSGSDRFADAWVGVNHRLVRESASPGVIAFADLALAERGSERTSHGKSASFGATVYRVNDPLVLSLTAAWRLNRARQDGAPRRDPGDSVMLNPEASFAANNDLTLSAGLLWQRVGAEAIDGVKQGLAHTRTSLTLGLAWAVSERSTLHFSGRSNASGGDGAELGLTWVVKLGELPKRQRWK
ncbi:MAG: hypothetical protein HY778_09070 [Betaproteobacteria bacterium]|nr:hypothetical protein [Betaproteobacteria bacterium]